MKIFFYINLEHERKVGLDNRKFPLKKKPTTFSSPVYLCRQQDEEDHEGQAVEGVVDGGEGGPAHQAEAQHGQHGREHDEQGHVARDGVVLQLEDVPA